MSSGVVGFNVAIFLRPVREIVRPARPGVGESAKKFAQHTKNGSKWAFYGALGELLRGNAAGGVVLGEFFADLQALMVGVWWVRIPCGCRSSAGDQFRMQFPHDSFKL